MGHPPQGPYGLPPSGQPGPMQPGDFTPAALNAAVRFATCDIDPPSAAYIDVDDLFLLAVVTNSFSGLITANIRILRPHGQIETVKMEMQVGAVFNALQTITIGCREGYILSAEIASNVNIGTGVLVYCGLAIQRGGTGAAQQVRCLIAGYLRHYLGLSWPDRPPIAPSDGAGFTFSQAVGNPAAGADWSFALPNFNRMSINMVSATLAAANAGTPRTVSLKITDGVNTLALIDSPNTQAINTTDQYTGYAGAFIGGTAGTHIYWPLPQPLILTGTWTIGTVTANINVGDQWSAIRISGLQWLDFI